MIFKGFLIFFLGKICRDTSHRVPSIKESQGKILFLIHRLFLHVNQLNMNAPSGHGPDFDCIKPQSTCQGLRQRK